MSASKSDIRHLLYEDENGQEVGLYEVQWLDPPPLERVPALRALLHDKDLYTAYQAALVLAAWGDDQGLAKIEDMINHNVHEHAELAPHRMYGYDNVYDEFARAAHLYGLSGKSPEAVLRIYRKLLGLYGIAQFESRLKYALLESNFSQLAPDILQAIKRALVLGHPYLASQLLPVLARWKPDEAMSFIPKFLSFPNQTPNPAANVAEALGFISSPESIALLKKLAVHPDEGVAEEAKESLARLSSPKT